MAITDTIRRLREKAGHTQEGMAELLEMTRSNYAYLEGRGEKLTIEQLQRIAGTLGIPLGEVLGIEGTTGEAEKYRVKELEKRVKELEEVADLHRERYDKLMGNITDFFSDHIIAEIRQEMTYTAINKGFLNESNVKGYFDIERNEDGTYQYYFDESLDERYDPYRDFFISDLLTERQLISLIQELPSIYMYCLDFLGNADLIADEKLKRARNKMYDEAFKSSKAKRYPGTKEGENK